MLLEVLYRKRTALLNIQQNFSFRKKSEISSRPTGIRKRFRNIDSSNSIQYKEYHGTKCDFITFGETYRHLPLLAHHHQGGCGDGVAGVHPYHPGSASPCFPLLQDPCYPLAESLLARLALPSVEGVLWIELPCDCLSWPSSERDDFAALGLGCYSASYQLPAGLTRAYHVDMDLILPMPIRRCCIQSHRRVYFLDTDLYCNRRGDKHSSQF